ncbi:MAG: peptidoglycan-binding protein [Magnetospiraceae bacterium]
MRSLTWAVLLLIAAIPLSGETPARAASGGGADQTRGAVNAASAWPLVRSVQRRLRDIGLYRGQMNGLLDDTTRAAVERYQAQAGLPVDGLVTEALREHLDDAPTQARRLLRRLEQARLRQIDEARTAIQSAPDTQDLLASARKVQRLGELSTAERAACAKSADSDCLIATALEDLVKVTDAEQRNWALGELAQARALEADIEGALGLTVRISDPRRVIESLHDTAVLIALLAPVETAVDMVGAIPIPRRRLAGYTEVAAALAMRGEEKAARDLAARAAAEASQLESPLDQVTVQAHAAGVLARAGAPQEGVKTLESLETAISRLPFDTHKGVALKDISAAWLKLENPDRAGRLLEEIPKDGPLADVARMDWAIAAARSGDVAAAMKNVSRIQDRKRRAPVWAEIALAHAERGETAAAEKAVQQGVSVLPTGTAGVAGRSMLAEAAAHFTAPDRAQEILGDLVGTIAAPAVSWRMARAFEARGDAPTATRLRERALTLARDLPAGLDRIWVLGDLAVLARADGESETAKDLQKDMLRAAQAIETPWFKVRALARTARVATLLSADDAAFKILTATP